MVVIAAPATTAAALDLVQAALLGEAIDAGPVLVFVADERMKYVAVNRPACDVLGYTREELLDLHVTDVVHAADAPSQYEEMVLSGARTGTARLTRKDGATLGFEYRAKQTRIGGMEFFVSVGVTSD